MYTACNVISIAYILPSFTCYFFYCCHWKLFDETESSYLSKTIKSFI